MAYSYAQTAKSSAFTQLVVSHMRKLYPEELADRAWDNVGLLLDSIDVGDEGAKKPVVLLTNDLTYAVAQEAIELGASVIVSYHPIIFRALKSITCADPQQATLLLLARHGIAVYAPHTALDAAPLGINSFLANLVEGSASIKSTSKPIKTVANPPPGFEAAGYGIEVTFSSPVPLAPIIKTLGDKLGGFPHLSVAVPPTCNLKDVTTTSVALCAGSGADILRGSNAPVLLTGEMSHHDALKATQEGRIVITTFHSNTERAFLGHLLQPTLEASLRSERQDVVIHVSKVDRDPFSIVDLATL